MSFRSYAMSKGIYEFEKSNLNKSKIYTEDIVYEHINTIFSAHERLKGCFIPINNLVNKMFEDFKVSELFLKQDIEKYKQNSKNELEDKILAHGYKFLYRIQNILDVISSTNYENIILRSMKSREICVYNVNLNEIYTGSNSSIYVKNIDEFCENILEYDYIKFLIKVKRSNSNIDFMRHCAYVCSKEKFEINSYNFILACVSFPYEFIRVISKYRDLGRNLSNYSDKLNFDSVLEKDGESII